MQCQVPGNVNLKSTLPLSLWLPSPRHVTGRGASGAGLHGVGSNGNSGGRSGT